MESETVPVAPGYVLRSHAEQIRQSLAITHQLPDVNALLSAMERPASRWSLQTDDHGGIVSRVVR